MLRTIRHIGERTRTRQHRLTVAKRRREIPRPHKPTLNLNQDVLIREQLTGKEAFDEYFRFYRIDPEEYRGWLRQPDGRLKMPLWEVMRIYGSRMRMDCDPPIETTIEVREAKL